MNRIIIAGFAALTLFQANAIAQEGSGFSVGGVGELGGTAASPVEENGWASLDDYRAARDCCGYTNTGTDAQLWTDAGNADANSPAQITGANCAAANYQALRSACTGAGSACQSTQRDTFLPMRDFNQQNPCLSPNYASYADYQAANARDFGLNQLDVNLVGEANTTTWDAYCPSSDCSTANRGQFLDAKAGKNLFLAALGDAATANQNGSLTWAQLTAQYGSNQVSVSDPFNSAPENEWLTLYLNESANNSPNAMASATSPDDWQSLVNTATANNSTIALWMIQRIQAGELATSYLTANLLGKAGLGQSYTSSGVVTQVVAAITDNSLTQAADVSSVNNIQTWIDGLITPVWAASPATNIAKYASDVENSGVTIVTSAATLSGSGTLSYSLTGSEASSFSVNSAGIITSSSSLSAGSFSFNVVATPSTGTAITKAFTLTVSSAAETIVAALGNAAGTSMLTGSFIAGSSIVTNFADFDTACSTAPTEATITANIDRVKYFFEKSTVASSEANAAKQLCFATMGHTDLSWHSKMLATFNIAANNSVTNNPDFKGCSWWRDKAAIASSSTNAMKNASNTIVYDVVSQPDSLSLGSPALSQDKGHAVLNYILNEQGTVAAASVKIRTYAKNADGFVVASTPVKTLTVNAIEKIQTTDKLYKVFQRTESSSVSTLRNAMNSPGGACPSGYSIVSSTNNNTLTTLKNVALAHGTGTQMPSGHRMEACSGNFAACNAGYNVCSNPTGANWNIRFMIYGERSGKTCGVTRRRSSGSWGTGNYPSGYSMYSSNGQCNDAGSSSGNPHVRNGCTGWCWVRVLCRKDGQTHVVWP